MGYFLGNKIPDYNPFWEEEDYKDQEDYWKWYHLGHDDGYASGYSQYGTDSFNYSKLLQENESLKALITTNARVSPEFDEYLKAALEQTQLSQSLP